MKAHFLNIEVKTAKSHQCVHVHSQPLPTAGFRRLWVARWSQWEDWDTHQFVLRSTVQFTRWDGYPHGRIASAQNWSVPGTQSVTGNPTEGQRATNNRVIISSQFLKCCWVRVKQNSCLVPQNETGSTRLWANWTLKAARVQGSCDSFLPQCPCFPCSCTVSLPFSSNKLVSWSLVLWLKQEALGWGWCSPHGFEGASPFQILRTAPLWWINYIWVWAVNAAERQPSGCGHLRSWGEDGQEQKHNKGWEWWRRKLEQKN